MKNYLEVIEQLEEETKTSKAVKIEVKDIKEAKEKLKVEEKEFEGLNYIKRFHRCFHEEDADRNKPCKIENL